MYEQVVENSPPGSLISRLSATDADSGTYGQLRYELRGFGAERFSVNASTGDLTVGVCGLSTCLDYEDQDIFTLTYTAVDGGGKFPLTLHHLNRFSNNFFDRESNISTAYHKN